MNLKRYLMLSLMLLSTIAISCKKDNIDFNSDFKKSQKAWLDFKAASNNSYRYTVTSGSWTGTSSETVVTIQNGIATGRSYVYKFTESTPARTERILEQWVEDRTTINTHPNAVPPNTLDQVYELAKTDWLIKRKGVKTYFERNNDGMISSCGYVEDGCQDDCFRGITISKIEKL